MINYHELRTRFRHKPGIGLHWVILAAVAIIMGLLTSCAYPSEISDDKAIKAIIGEAEGEIFKGKLAVACAIRNRGTLSGVFGLNAPRVKNKLYSAKIYQESLKAWYLSEDDTLCDGLIHGATHWEGTKFKIPYWAKDMTLTAHIGNQNFYREVK